MVQTGYFKDYDNLPKEQQEELLANLSGPLGVDGPAPEKGSKEKAIIVKFSHEFFTKTGLESPEKVAEKSASELKLVETGYFKDYDNLPKEEQEVILANLVEPLGLGPKKPLPAEGTR